MQTSCMNRSDTITFCCQATRSRDASSVSYATGPINLQRHTQTHQPLAIPFCPRKVQQQCIRDASLCMAAIGYNSPTCAALAARPSRGSGTSRHSICRSWEVVISRRLLANRAAPATTGSAPASLADCCGAAGSVTAPPALAGSSSAAGIPAMCPAPCGSPAEAAAGCAVRVCGPAGVLKPSCCCTAAWSENMLRACPGCRRSGAGTGKPACRGTRHAST